MQAGRQVFFSSNLPQGVTKTTCEFRVCACSHRQRHSNINRPLVSRWVLHVYYGASWWLAHIQRHLLTRRREWNHFAVSVSEVLPLCHSAAGYVHTQTVRVALSAVLGHSPGSCDVTLRRFSRCHRCLKFKPRDRPSNDLRLGCVHISPSFILTVATCLFTSDTFELLWIESKGSMDLHLIALFLTTVLRASKALPAPVGKWLFSDPLAAFVELQQTHGTNELCLRMPDASLVYNT